MRIHETGDRAHRPWWGWEDPNLREYLAGADNCGQPGTADDRNPSFEQRASSCMTVLHMGVMGAANVDPSGHTRPSAAIREFPSRDIGPAHCDPPSLSPRRSALEKQREPAKCKCWQREHRNSGGLLVKCLPVADRSATKISARPASRAAGEIAQSFLPV